MEVGFLLFSHRSRTLFQINRSMFSGLAASLGYGAAAELLRRTGSGGTREGSSIIMTEANIRRLVSKLVQMRGAALKLGQFMSIQGICTYSSSPN
jgi:predicted unusual protein kinase regulating ubiquinone biosynthesis (AarF/ABC1/UbiB family)